MPPGYRLGRLKVSEPRHDKVGPEFSLIQQRRDKARQILNGPFGLVPDPNSEIGGNLVVSASCGVEPAGGTADDLLQPGLHIHVDILKGVGKPEVAVFYL